MKEQKKNLQKETTEAVVSNIVWPATVFDILLQAVVFSLNIKKPERNWCLAKGHVLWYYSSRRKEPVRVHIYDSTLHSCVCAPVCQKRTHGLRSVFITCWQLLPYLQKCAYISRALLRGSRWESAGEADVHGPPQTCCIHLNKAGEQQRWKKLINDFSSSSTTIIHKVNIATGSSSPAVIFLMLFKYFHLTFNMQHF